MPSKVLDHDQEWHKAVSAILALRADFSDDRIVRRLLGMRREQYEAFMEAYAASRVGLSPTPHLSNAFCPRCLATTIPVEDVSRLSYIERARPTPDRSMCQFHVCLEDLNRRVIFISRNGVEDSDILYIGDDDFISVALCEVCRPRSVTVIDNDQRLLIAIDSLARDRGLPIHTIRYDLERVLHGEPPSLATVDTFITDPPYAVAGTLAFVFVGAFFVRLGGNGYIAYPMSDYEAWSFPYLFELQRFLIQVGFVVAEKVNRFHVYENEQGVSSGIMRVRRLVDASIELPSVNPAHFLPTSCRRFSHPRERI